MLPRPAVSTAALGFTILGGVLASETELFRRAGLYECPELCSVAGPNTGNWTRFVSNNDLKWCKNDTMLINLPLFVPLSDPNAHSVFQACLSSRGDEAQSLVATINGREVEGGGFHKQSNVSFVQSSAKNKLSSFANDASVAIRELQAKYLDVPNTDTNKTIYFAKHGDSVVGVYVGGDVQKQSIAATLMQRLQQHLTEGKDLSQTVLFQLCGDGRNADSVAGVVADGRGGLDSVFAVQEFVSRWADSRCVSDVDGPTKAVTMDIAYLDDAVLPGQQQNSTAGNGNGIGGKNSTTTVGATANPRHQLGRRADCKVTQVVSGDSCASLATKCKIAPAEFTKLHPQKDFCSSLKPGQWVCCSSGTLPDMRPKPNADGSCFSYKVVSQDSCSKIAAAHNLKDADIATLNQKTWGFAGCSSLWPDMLLCLSSGDPPMPAPVANAKCGPQVPGTKKPAKGTSMASLNPCPLKACCNVWGQCGTTEEFCTESTLGPPGTSKPGQNGCISNCGMKIVNNGVGPSRQMTLGYFEAFNYNRGCLNMDVTQMSKSISHIHFAFVDVTEGFQVSTAKVQDQWNKFKAMKGFHKVAAFGGWDASTKPTSYWIFREGVKPENRNQLAANLANFIISNDMDGIDLDWEYPGAQDIPGIPKSDPFDGKAYVALLQNLRFRLGTSRTISIAAPASYWYLQNFPIEEISKVVDYIVYMTYDLHGQWDYNNKWAQPGCGGVSCLRSHVNMTETINSLAMITKAGVPSHKVVVGVSSYGRSFQMTKAGCTGPQCGFTGPASSAKKGRCTDTNGYISNAEIDEIIRSGSVGGKRAAAGVQLFTDNTESQILVYDDTQWVAYMDDSNKAARKAKWAGLNFAGTTDWAVDLATFTPGDSNKECWRSKHCQSPGATKTDDDTWRWKAVCSEEAWDAAIRHYKSVGNKDTHFSAVTSHFFGGLENMYCDILASNNECNKGYPCLQGPNTGPAATFILNSFVVLSNTFFAMYDGIHDSQDTLGSLGNINSLVQTFAPAPKEVLALKVILDIISFGLTAATGPFFNNFLRNTPWGLDNKNSGDNTKDTIRAIIGFSFTVAKDSTKPTQDPKANISTQLSTIVMHLKVALTAIQAQIFSGSDTSIDVLHSLISDGKLISAVPSKRLDLENRISKVFYAMLIPNLWRLKGWSPVLIDTDTACDSKDEIKLVPNENSKVCVDGKRYYLLRPDGEAETCPGGGAQHWGMPCRTNKMKNMDGFDKLIGGKNWAGLLKEDIAASIVARTKVDWKNPSSESELPDFSDSSQFDKLWDWIEGDDMVRSPGLIDIPVCKMDEASKNWGQTKNNYYSWPCNRP